ncbi:unnamed protein product, partial [Rotaria socialis]
MKSLYQDLKKKPVLTAQRQDAGT